jgi:hypothetical protein
MQTIIWLAGKEEEQIDFFTDAELQLLPCINLGTSIPDKEDYSPR